jgi:hypothetical protein
MVSKLESGDYNVSLKTICDIFAKLGLSVELQINPPEIIKKSDFKAFFDYCDDLNGHAMDTTYNVVNTKCPHSSEEAAAA